MKGIGILNSDFPIIKDGIQSTIENVKRILLTIPGERVGNTEFGSSLKKFLFEPDFEVINSLETILKDEIERWEPTVTIESIEINMTEEHIAKVDMKMFSNVYGEPISYELALEY